MKVRKAVRHAIYAPPFVSRWITNRFHKLYYYRRAQTWRNTRWLGTDVLKCPLDLWIYQEMLHEIQPDWILETGTAFGGSASYLASLCDVMGRGQVLSIDPVVRTGRPEHPRIHYLRGYSTAPEVLAHVERAISGARAVLVLLDSDHSYENVLAELRAYQRFVTPGSYFVVEDGNVGGHPVAREFGAGPLEAVRAFLAENDAFEIDRAREKFYLTFNPSGYLRRVR
ncbi:MAG TPA: CmcI family methyltransferase [Myxococcota bacterium]|nr:CmcI family methyltransferase [Myxococcota bacterium]